MAHLAYIFLARGATNIKIDGKRASIPTGIKVRSRNDEFRGWMLT
jgi:hypothetical protein